MKLKMIINAMFELRTEDGKFCKESKSLDKLIKEVKQQAQTAYENQDCGFDYDVFIVTQTERDLSPFEKTAGVKVAYIKKEDHILRLSFTNEEFEVSMAGGKVV